MFNKVKYLIIVYGKVNGEILITYGKYIMHTTQRQKRGFRGNLVMLVLRR